MLKLEEGEKIYSWDVICTTTLGRKLAGVDLGLEFTLRCSDEIDGLFEQEFPFACEWQDPCESCKKCGETTCGNDTVKPKYRQKAEKEQK